MYSSKSSVYVCVVLIGLVTFSSENCRRIRKYMYACQDRNSYGRCSYYGYEDVYITECDHISSSYLKNERFDDYLEIIDSDFDGMAPGMFQESSKLQNLTIFNSNISNLKPGVFNGLHLFNLNLSHNCIEAISSGVFNAMYTLNSLDLSGNKIKSLDNESFIGMSAITDLYLNDNQILSMPTLTNYPLLTTVNISNNKINKLDFLYNCSTFKSLSISGNGIEYIDNIVFDNMYLLEYLDLSKNRIKSVNDDTFSGAHSLKEIYLNDNRILRIPSLANCSKLETLDISNNEINNLEHLQNLPSLNILDLSRNPLFNGTNMPVDLFRNVSSLRSLNLSCTSIQKLSVGSFSGLQYLEMLDLSSNNLSYLPKGIFHDLTSLRSLYINNNQLSYFEYDGFSNLYEINLNNNVWNCHTLSVIIKRFRNVILRGNAYNTTSVYGIPCYEETKDFIQNLPEYNSSSLNGFDKDYLSYIISSQNDINKALIGLGNSLNYTILGRRDEKESELMEIFEDFKHFLNETNSYQKNYSENYWKMLERYHNSSQNTKYISNRTESDIKRIILDTFLNFFNDTNLYQKNSPENYWKMLEMYHNSLQNSRYNVDEIIDKIATAIASTQNRTESDIKQMLANFPNAQFQKDGIQLNGSIDHLNKLNTLQINIQQSLMDIKNILASSKTVSQALTGDAKYKIDDEKWIIEQGNYFGKRLSIPLYCGLVVLCGIFILLLINQVKRIRSYRNNRIECNSLTTLEI